MRARTLSLLLLLLAAAASSFTPSTSTDTIYRNTSLTGNQTLVSAGGIYALGFFSPAGADGRTYPGIWYASIPGPTTVVWVANRRDPVVNSPAALQLSDGGRLVILDGNNDTVWSSAVPTVGNVTAAQLLDTGNLVLSADGSGSWPSVAWQSFDYPTDTLLPGMKLGVDTRAGITRNITAWRSPSDPSPGDVTFKLVIGGLPQFFLLRGATRVYTSGPWNGDILTGVPYLKAHDFTFKLVYSPDETYYSYFIREPSLLSRLVVDGAATQLKRFSLNNGAWSSFWYYPTDQCDYYAKCGPFGYCDTDRSPPCSCLPGFVPRSPDQWSQREWSAGCVRRTNLSCDGGDGDGFWVVNRMKLPQATDATVYAGMTLDQCRQACLGNCSCGAYAAANNSGGIGVGCVIWTVDLLDMRQYPIVVQDVYIRLAQSDIDALKAAAADNHQRSHKSKLIIIIVATISGVLFLLAAVGCCCFWMKKASRKGEGEDMASSLPPSTADFALPYRVRSQPSLSPPPSRIRSQPSLSPVRDHKQLLDASEETRYYSDKDVDLPLFELEVTLAATDNFAEHKRIGAGGFGPVYGLCQANILIGKRKQLKYSSHVTRSVIDLTALHGEAVDVPTAWMLWREGRSMELLDEALGASFHHSRVLRCIQVALLCVEAQPRNRPLMSSVVTMLASDNAVLPEPNEPGVNPGMSTSSDTESSRTQNATANYVTVTRLEARSTSTGHSSL
ncbi:unnamed protein product [Miscanthus lutarioriparius]|uniref:Receptor-like serine/threonine-protein kinase n=1 Tax=Miscanthus lutarioriparius TaxID=422564 RepID=A0A811NWZ2_9POAL|nr:unnamed protein product [Miscanthus lutarioriparius]